jgi:hypothetical protein
LKSTNNVFSAAAFSLKPSASMARLRAVIARRRPSR